MDKKLEPQNQETKTPKIQFIEKENKPIKEINKDNSSLRVTRYLFIPFFNIHNINILVKIIKVILFWKQSFLRSQSVPRKQNEESQIKVINGKFIVNQNHY